MFAKLCRLSRTNSHFWVWIFGVCIDRTIGFVCQASKRAFRIKTGLASITIVLNREIYIGRVNRNDKKGMLSCYFFVKQRLSDLQFFVFWVCCFYCFFDMAKAQPSNFSLAEMVLAAIVNGDWDTNHTIYFVLLLFLCWAVIFFIHGNKEQ